jgi:hypothetical protein
VPFGRLLAVSLGELPEESVPPPASPCDSESVFAEANSETEIRAAGSPSRGQLSGRLQIHLPVWP